MKQIPDRVKTDRVRHNRDSIEGDASVGESDGSLKFRGRRKFSNKRGVHFVVDGVSLNVLVVKNIDGGGRHVACRRQFHLMLQICNERCGCTYRQEGVWGLLDSCSVIIIDDSSS